jgi:selenium metabolism protein YedF
MQVVDGKGLLCPQPLILTRKALKNCLPGETLKIECDNQTAYQNILTYLKDQSLTPSGKVKEGIFQIEVINQQNKTAEENDSFSMNPGICSSAYVIAIGSDRMGEGDPQLGSILMKGFLNALLEQPVLPTHLIFYNSGVKLTIKDSGVISSIKELEAGGVDILVCGTCTDFYELKDQLGAGRISNMFTLTEIMAKTGHVVKP